MSREIKVVRVYGPYDLAHYHTERNHQGIENRLIEEPDEPPPDGVIECRERLGGMLKHYHRMAA